MTTTVRNFVGGDWREAASAATLAVTNPASGAELARVPLSTARDVDAAVQAAKAAFPGFFTDQRVVISRW